MSKVCQVTGKRPRSGNNVSHANNKTKRKFYPNLQTKKFYIPEEDRWEPRASLPRPMNVGAAAVGNAIYILPYGDEPMWKYDPTRDSYECMGPLPLENFHCFAVTSGSSTASGAFALRCLYLYSLGGHRAE